MSDNRRRFVAINQAIKKLYPVEPRGNLARHLTTLAMLISGIVASNRTQLPAIANKIPTFTKVESRVKRFKRWVDNQRIDYEGYYLPYAQQLLTNLASHSLVLIMFASLSSLLRKPRFKPGWAKMPDLDAKCGLQKARLAHHLVGGTRK